MGRLPSKYIVVKRLAHAVVDRYVAKFIHTHPTISSEDVDSNQELQREIAAEISKDEHFRKPVGSIIEARDRLRMRYEQMSREQVGELEKELRREPVGHASAEVGSMRERLADYSAQDGADEGRGDYDSLYSQELEILRQKPDRRVIGLFHVEESGKKLTRAQERAEGFYREDEDGVPDMLPFDTWTARFEKRKLAS